MGPTIHGLPVPGVGRPVGPPLMVLAGQHDIPVREGERRRGGEEGERV